MKIKLIILLSFLVYLVQAQKILNENKFLDCSQTKSKLNFKNITNSGEEVDLFYLNINWELYPDTQYIKGNILYKFKIKQNTKTISLDLSTALHLDSIIYHNQNITYNHSNNTITILFSDSLYTNQTDSFRIFYQGAPNSEIPGQAVFVTDKYEYNGDSIPMIWTLSEPYGASQWWPCKQGLSDKIDSMDIYILTDTIYKCGTAGMLISEDIIQNKKLIHWKHRYPMVSYLLGIVLTKFEENNSYIKLNNGDSILMKTYSLLNDSDQIFPNDNRLDSIFNIYSDLFITYPFIKEKYGHMMWTRGGGMEHQTMSSMSCLDCAALVNHELAHQWFGNYITCKSWQDIWLNEGFATWLTMIGYERMWGGYWERRSDSLTIDHITSSIFGSVFVYDTTDVSRIFDSRLSYDKGAMLLQMLRWELGDSLMFAGINSYLNDSNLKYGFASSDDLIRNLEEVSDTSLTEFFDDWLYGQGYPNYEISFTNNENYTTIEINQTPSNPTVNLFQMHVPLQLWYNGKDTLIKFYNTHSNQIYFVDLPNKVDSIVPDPEFKLVAKYSVVQNIITTKEPKINITPNPFNNYINIEITNLPLTIENLTITDISGRTYNITANDNTSQKINLSFLSKGSYILSVQTSEFVIKKKIIKN